MLDKPLAHFGPSSQVKRQKLLQRLNDGGAMVILFIQSVHALAPICFRKVLLEGGVVVKDEPVSDNVIREVNAYLESE